MREFIKAVRERHRQITWAYPPAVSATITIPDNLCVLHATLIHASCARLDQLDSNLKQDAAGGFAQTYKAWCNLRGTPASDHVIQFIRDLGQRCAPHVYAYPLYALTR